MKTIFNAYLLKAAIIILTPAMSFNLYAVQKSEEIECPKFKAAEEALEFFMQADRVGARLTSNTATKLKKCISFDDENSWDLFQVVSSYEIKECAGRKKPDKSCLEVKYGTYGNLLPTEPFHKNKELEFITQKVELIKNGETWEITGLSEIPPMLSKEGAMLYLKTFQGKENTKAHNEWLRSAALDIENLK